MIIIKYISKLFHDIYIRELSKRIIDRAFFAIIVAINAIFIV